jgi:uncharacterized membrane protein
MTSETNVARAERWASGIGGAAMAAYGLKRLKEDRGAAGAMITAAAGALIYRSATGFCPAYSAAGINTARDREDTRQALGGSRGVHVKEAVTINRSADELYDFWRSFEGLPRFMNHLVSVRTRDRRFSHWVAKAPAGRTVEWDAEVINDVPGELIGWRTLDGSDVVSAGSVRFKPGPSGEDTEVLVHLQYDPPAGKAGATVAWLLGYDPSQTIRQDLRRFKQLLETGEVPTIDGQPRGNRS